MLRLVQSFAHINDCKHMERSAQRGERFSLLIMGKIDGIPEKWYVSIL